MADAVHPYKDKTKVDTFNCFLTLNGSTYFLSPLHPGDSPSPDFVRGYRLEKNDAKHPGVYDVVQTHTGFECDCHDFQHRRKGLDSLGCKHLRAMFFFGFLHRDDVASQTSRSRGPRVMAFPLEDDDE